MTASHLRRAGADALTAQSDAACRNCGFEPGDHPQVALERRDSEGRESVLPEGGRGGADGGGLTLWS